MKRITVEATAGGERDEKRKKNHRNVDCKYRLSSHTKYGPRSIQHSIHGHPLCLGRPDLFRALGETSYGTRVGFIGSDIVFTVYLFICI
jgi:hypothetical protein